MTKPFTRGIQAVKDSYQAATDAVERTHLGSFLVVPIRVALLPVTLTVAVPLVATATVYGACGPRMARWREGWQQHVLEWRETCAQWRPWRHAEPTGHTDSSHADRSHSNSPHLDRPLSDSPHMDRPRIDSPHTDSPAKAGKKHWWHIKPHKSPKPTKTPGSYTSTAPACGTRVQVSILRNDLIRTNHVLAPSMHRTVLGCMASNVPDDSSS
jgi:hypothetical protein